MLFIISGPVANNATKPIKNMASNLLDNLGVFIPSHFENDFCAYAELPATTRMELLRTSIAE